MSVAKDFSLAELMIVAASEAWRNNGEILASGLGILPRLGAGLAKSTHSPELLMTDSECFLVEEPIPVGPRGDYVPKYSGYMGFERVFECVWGGRRHAMIGPTQLDRFGQTNLSAVGPDYYQPKIAMLGVRGLPGNSINHKNSFFMPSHTTRALVNEVDMVSGVGFNPERWKPGMDASLMSIGIVLTDLCVFDYNGPEHAPQVLSLHPGVSFEEVQENTGFALLKAPGMGETPHPTEAQLAVIRRLDPHDLRSKQLKGNPAGIRQGK